MQGIVLKKSKMTMSFVILLFNVITGKIIIDNSFWSAVITDMMLYEHENIDFDIDVLFYGREFNGTYSDTVVLKIADSHTFSTKSEPDSIYHSIILK